MDVGEAEVPTRPAIGQTFVVDSEQMQDGRMERYHKKATQMHQAEQDVMYASLRKGEIINKASGTKFRSSIVSVGESPSPDRVSVVLRGSSIDDSNKIRSSVGVGVDWFTPVGPLNR